MKTTIDLPDGILKRGKMEAVKRHTTFKKLVIEGLESILGEESPRSIPSNALARLKKGYHLGGSPLSREKAHEC